MKNNEEYISLYDYTGQGAKGIGKQVYETAKEKNIRVIYENLPEDKVTGEYTKVATYPKTFLDEYFGKTTEVVQPDAAGVIINEFRALYNRIETLETQVAELTKKLETNVTNSNEHDDDDLPF